MKLNKIVSLLLCSSLLLCGCSSANEETETSDDQYTIEPADVVNVTTDMGLVYTLFLKLGTLSEDEVSMELVGYTHTPDSSGVELWELNNGDSDMCTYTRSVGEELRSVYTKTFPIIVDDINKWIDTEVVGLDTLYSVEGERLNEEGVSWSWHWQSGYDACKLQVYSTGVTGEYIGLVSFTRYGVTGIDNDFIVDQREQEG